MPRLEDGELLRFQYAWLAAGRARTTVLNYCRWLAKLDATSPDGLRSMTDDDLAAVLVKLTPPQRHLCLRAARAWAKHDPQSAKLGSTLKTPKQIERVQPTVTMADVDAALAPTAAPLERPDVRARALVALLISSGLRI